MKRLSLSRLFVSGGRLRSGWRVASYLACYLLGLLVVQTPIMFVYLGYLASTGGRSASDLLASLQPDRLPIGLYLALKLGELMMLLALTALFRRLLDRRSWTTLGWGLDRGWKLDLLFGLALGGAQMLFIFGVEWAGGWLAVALLEPAALARGLGKALIGAGLFLAVAVGEELMFRGYLQVNLSEGLGVMPALALTSLLFGVFHALNPNFGWVALLNIALAGASLGYGRIVSGNLWLPLAYHLSWNFCQGSLLSLPVSGVSYGGLLAVSDRGIAPLITGAAFGPEGGLIGTLALLLSFPLFWLWDRRRQYLSRGAQASDPS
jgi:membrane protease YdiL (CAAX protease family)